MNGELLMAVHEQPGEVATLTDTGPPAATTDIDEDDDQLAAYNEYLRRLNHAQHRRHAG